MDTFRGEIIQAYYYNRRYFQIGDVNPIKIFLPRDEAEKLIGIANTEELYKLEAQAALAKAAEK